MRPYNKVNCGVSIATAEPVACACDACKAAAKRTTNTVQEDDDDDAVPDLLTAMGAPAALVAKGKALAAEHKEKRLVAKGKAMDAGHETLDAEKQ